MIIILYFLIGAVAGMLSGLLGVGGGVFVVPALAFVFHLLGFRPDSIMHMAVATSLSSMIFTSGRSLISHYRRDIKFWPIYRRLAIGVIVGTVTGVVVGHFLHSNALKIIFGIVVLLMAAKMIFFRKTNPKRKLPKTPMMNIISFLIGAKSGLLGLGGGVVTVPFLTYCNVDMRRAVTTSTAVSLTIATLGTISVFITGTFVKNLPPETIGYVYWPATLAVAAGSVLFAPLGARVSHWLPIPILKQVFGIFLLVIAIHMFW